MGIRKNLSVGRIRRLVDDFLVLVGKRPFNAIGSLPGQVVGFIGQGGPGSQSKTGAVRVVGMQIAVARNGSHPLEDHFLKFGHGTSSMYNAPNQPISFGCIGVVVKHNLHYL